MLAALVMLGGELLRERHADGAHGNVNRSLAASVAAMPSGPKTASETAWSSASMVMTTSAPRAASPTEGAAAMPSARKASAFAWVRFQTVTVCPAR